MPRDSMAASQWRPERLVHLLFVDGGGKIRTSDIYRRLVSPLQHQVAL